MKIETVKLQGAGYLVNGTMSVPNAEGNRHYQMVQDWITEGNEPEPEFTHEQINRNIQLEINSEAQRYLDDTDWYELRELRDSTKPVPQDVLDKRQASRDAII